MTHWSSNTRLSTYNMLNRRKGLEHAGQTSNRNGGQYYQPQVHNRSSGKPETEMVDNRTASIKTWTTPAGKPSSPVAEILELASVMMKWSVL